MDLNGIQGISKRFKEVHGISRDLRDFKVFEGLSLNLKGFQLEAWQVTSGI